MVARKFMTHRSMVKAALIFSASLLHTSSFAADLYYYDGTVKRPLVVDNQQWASVKGDTTGKSVEVRPLAINEKNVQDRLASKSVSGSPVFRVGEAGAPMALPGGVILNPKYGDLGVVARLKAKGLVVERPIGNSGALLVRSAEGIASLDLANRLHESGEFESVSPNWWRERRKK
jgi:hypothetical protein